MTARKNNIVFHKCHGGCTYVTSNRASFRKHLDSVSHMINNRIRNKNACRRCIAGDPYDGSHRNYHEMVEEYSSIDCFNDTLMNERLKDFKLTCNEYEQAMQWNGNGFTG